jgi:glucokinase
MVVIGGGVAQIGDLLLEPIRRTVQQRSLRVASRAVRITAALLGRQSSGMGAIVQALSFILHQMAE